MKKLGLIAAAAAVLALAGCNNGAQEWVNVTSVDYDYRYDVTGSVTATTGSVAIKYEAREGISLGTISWTENAAKDTNVQNYNINPALYLKSEDGTYNPAGLTFGITKIGDEYFVTASSAEDDEYEGYAASKFAGSESLVKIEEIDIEDSEFDAVFSYEYISGYTTSDKGERVPVKTKVEVNLTFTRL